VAHPVIMTCVAPAGTACRIFRPIAVRYCASPAAENLVCSACLADPPACAHTVAAVSYAFLVDAMIYSLKYRANLGMAPILTDLLITQIHPLTFPDFIVPMPLHPARLRERGFNQALEIARCIAKKLVPPCRTSASALKTPFRRPACRGRNARKISRGAFSCEMDLTGKHIAVLDDVMTTGATLNELARLLRKCGAVKVSGWVVARTLRETAGVRDSTLSV
jgi:ComF family protein